MRLPVQTDENLQELAEHGDYFFPLEIHMDDLDEFPNRLMGCHWHKQVEYNYVLEGTAQFQVSGRTYIVHAGEGLFINSNCLHQAQVFGEDKCVFFCIVFQATLLSGFSNSIIAQKYVLPILESKEFPAFYFDSCSSLHQGCNQKILEIYHLYQEKVDFYEIKIQILLQEIWLSMLQSNEKIIPAPMAAPTYDEQRLKAILTFLENNYAAKLSLEEIASSANISKSECCRFLKQTLNRTPFQILIDYRLTKSIQLLKETDLSISEIAEQVGFDSASYFSTIFKKNFRHSPKDFRKYAQNIYAPKKE